MACVLAHVAGLVPLDCKPWPELWALVEGVAS